MTKQSKNGQGRARTILANLSAFFYQNWIISLITFVLLVGGGIVSYSTLLPREGFPTIQFPLTVVQGGYFVNDKELVDQQIAIPLSDGLSQLEDVDSYSTTAGDNFFFSTVFFDSEVDSQEGAQKVEDLYNSLDLPEAAQASFTPIDPAAYLNRYDILVTVYSTNDGIDPGELQYQAQLVADQLQANDDLTLAQVELLVESGRDPINSGIIERQTAFNLIGVRESEDSKLVFHPAVTIGVDKREDIDLVELSKVVDEAVDSLDTSELDATTNVTIGAERGETVNTQIASLESNLLTGVLAVVAISLLFISWRASAVTAIFMVSVVVVSTLILFAIGSSLNTITLFGLILALGLFVDDATIIVEAIDYARTGKSTPIELLRKAIARVALASFAGTVTTVLVFLPLAFVEGVLGEFIRILPITVIIALVTSLVLSLTLIPFLSRFTILTTSMAKRKYGSNKNPVIKIERKAAESLANTIRWISERSLRGWLSAGVAVLFSFLMIGGAVALAGRTEFNIFPSSKDADQLLVSVEYYPGTTIDQAEDIARNVNNVILESIGNNVEKVIYGGFTMPNERQADMFIELTPFTDRDTKSPELIKDLEAGLFAIEARTTVRQLDAGPPAEEFPFKVQVFGDEESATLALAADISEFLINAELQRTTGEEFSVIETKVDGAGSIVRQDGQRLVQLSAKFDADDTSALVVATEEAVKTEFDAERLAQDGFSENDLGFDFGQESENAESFSALGLVFPIALLAMFVVLGLQFRSVVQPLLIFMAIPFSLFGVFSGLILTDNPLSFFSMIGLIGLIGIAVNNTILLVDYANQERQEGNSIVEAIALASEKRFRPLTVTTITTIAALLPLALADPFWESLAFTIIFGLASSTLLVIIAFPYYYIFVEKLRMLTKSGFKKLRKKRG